MSKAFDDRTGQIEGLQYRPEHITVLFVGEAAPASDSFFYRGNSGLTNYMRDALDGPKGDIEFF